MLWSGRLVWTAGRAGAGLAVTPTVAMVAAPRKSRLEYDCVTVHLPVDVVSVFWHGVLTAVSRSVST